MYSLLISSNDSTLNAYVKQNKTEINELPEIYIYAENNLLRKMYSMLYNNRFSRILVPITKYKVLEKIDIEKKLPMQLLAYPNEKNLIISIVPEVLS